MINWWLVEVPYWFTVGFWPTFLEIFRTRCKKDNFTQGMFVAHKVRLNQTLENLKKSEKLEIFN